MIPSKFRVVGKDCYLEVYNRKGNIVNESIIDYEDYDKVVGLRFHQSTVKENNGYVRIISNTGTKLANLIVGKAPKGMYVDHISRITLDNRKKNLRFVTSQQNGMNRSKTKNKKTSKYKGVCWDKGRKYWKAEIKLNQKNMFIGRFMIEREAAKAYNNKAVELFGEYAVLNKEV